MLNTNQTVSSLRDKIAKYVMVVLGLTTLGAFANAAYELGVVAPDRIVAHVWEMLAFPVFAGLFTLLGLYPRRMPGLWELVLFQKAGITGFSLIAVGTASGTLASDNPMNRLVIDAVVVALIVVSYLLTKGWRAWVKGAVDKTAA
jgi:hypothetical protein